MDPSAGAEDGPETEERMRVRLTDDLGAKRDAGIEEQHQKSRDDQGQEAEQCPSRPQAGFVCRLDQRVG